MTGAAAWLPLADNPAMAIPPAEDPTTGKAATTAPPAGAEPDPAPVSSPAQSSADSPAAAGGTAAAGRAGRTAPADPPAAVRSRSDAGEATAPEAEPADVVQHRETAGTARLAPADAPPGPLPEPTLEPRAAEPRAAEPTFEPRAAVPKHALAVPALRATRTGGIWVAVIVAAIMLIFLLIFILQNLTTVTVNLLGFSWSIPLGVAMLFAAIAGAMLVALVGTARILQLRRFARRAAAAGHDYRAATESAGASSGRVARRHRQP